jgi:phosphopantetheinyl transferase
MNDEEMAIILNAERPEVAFIRLWTQKEAVLKLKGTGITDNLKTVLDGLPVENTAVENTAVENTAVKITTVVNEEKGYIYSIATY